MNYNIIFKSKYYTSDVVKTEILTLLRITDFDFLDLYPVGDNPSEVDTIIKSIFDDNEDCVIVLINKVLSSRNRKFLESVNFKVIIIEITI